MEFEVPRGVTMKNTVFWDVMPCGVVENQSFRGTIHYHCEGSVCVLQVVINTGSYRKDDLW
jgi:hypothetical protein